jgi:3-dehydroquinate synthase
VGGGIIQDLCAFVAHVYHRGMAWRFLPTTLLAMCDSCIGAKSSINLGPFKNQLGAFHAPKCIAVTTAFLSTLSEGDLASGYGEILKLMVTGSEAHLQRLERAVAAGGLRNLELPALIRASLDVKRALIEVDEFDTAERLVLNYGHTFGHALETLSGHAVPHGQAVAWGMDLVNALAVRWGLLDAGVRERMRDFVVTHLKVRHPPVEADRLLEAVGRDKKAHAGSVTLAVLREVGRLERLPRALDAELRAALVHYLASDDRFVA